jgi:hypothetical protein
MIGGILSPFENTFFMALLKIEIDFSPGHSYEGLISLETLLISLSSTFLTRGLIINNEISQSNFYKRTLKAKAKET